MEYSLKRERKDPLLPKISKIIGRSIAAIFAIAIAINLYEIETYNNESNYQDSMNSFHNEINDMFFYC